MKKNNKTKIIIITLLAITICVSVFFSIENLTDEILFLFSIIISVLLIKNIYQEEKNYKIINGLISNAKDLHFRLKELDNLKTEFVSLASHQLRAPLAKIQGYSSMILEEDFGNLPNNLKEPVNRIFLSSQNLGSLLNDFLDVAHIEKGELRYKLATNNLIEIIDKTIFKFEDVLRNSNIKLITTYSKNSEIKVLCDPNKTLSAISKVIDNAIRYTPIGEIRISVAEKDNDAIITIKDTGIGIKSENINELFQKFKRGDNAYNASITGSGLGLYVAREIIESQDGKIWLKSDGPGKGTTVFIAFPYLEIRIYK